MGCDQSLLKCNNFCSGGVNKNNLKSTHIDDYEFENKNGNSTNREINTNRSDISENLFIHSNLENNFKSVDKKHKFLLDLEKVKNIQNNKNLNFESDRSNNSVNIHMNLSEIKDGIETNRRNGKAFILLIKEFNFIHKLYRKCNNSNDDKENLNLTSPMGNEMSFTSNNNDSISVMSNYTVNSIQTEMSKNFQIKSSILKETKIKNRSKEFFSKLKNLIFIPVISITGEVENSFVLMKENKNMIFINYIIGIPIFDNIFTYLFNFIQNFHSDLNNCNFNKNEESRRNNFENPLIEFLSFIKLIKFKKIKFSFNIHQGDDDILNFGVGLNMINMSSIITDNNNLMIKNYREIFEFINEIISDYRNSIVVEEFFSIFSLRDLYIENTGFVIVLLFNSNFNIKNYINKVLKYSNKEDLEGKIKMIEENLIKFNYSYMQIKRLILKTGISIDSNGSKVDVKSISLKREVKSTNNENFTSSNNNQFVKIKYEIITFDLTNEDTFYSKENKINSPIINYEYQL